MIMQLMFTVAIMAQHDVTKFLGIPVDGSRSEMIQKLEAKGYKYDKVSDLLTGEFNGRDVFIQVQTNNNKVWKIVVGDTESSDVINIKIRFNNLCQQFELNTRYESGSSNQLIPDKEDIGFEMTVHKKRYEAGFFQKGGDGNADFSRSVWFMINNPIYNKYSILLFYENGYNMPNGEDL